MSDPLCITLKLAAEKSGLSKKVLSELIKKGEIQGTKPGKEVLVYWDTLKRYLSKHSMQSA